MNADLSAFSPEAFETAYRRIKPHARLTPVVEIEADTFGNPSPVSLKLELLQHAGAFKARGALNNLLSRDVPKAGVAAASGGNHGAAVAFAASTAGVKATIFVPKISSPAKRAKIKSFGADLVVTGSEYAEAAQACEDYVQKTGALSVHAYDSIETILGQGTVGLEWEEQVSNLDTVFVAVGGGGLISGVAGWFQNRVNVIGVEPEGANALSSALSHGAMVDVSVNSIAADSLGARRVGTFCFSLAQELKIKTMTVPDGAIEDAQKALWKAIRIVAEPGGAAALAPLLTGLYKPAPDERIGILVCGGNINVHAISGVLEN